MKLSQLIKALAIFTAMAVSPLYADCAACDSANPDSNAETQQEPDESADTTDTPPGNINNMEINNANDSYYLNNTSYSSSLSDAPASDNSNNSDNNQQ